MRLDFATQASVVRNGRGRDRYAHSRAALLLQGASQFCSCSTSKNLAMWPWGRLAMSLDMCQTIALSLSTTGWILLDSWQSWPWYPLPTLIGIFSEFSTQNLFVGKICCMGYKYVFQFIVFSPSNCNDTQNILLLTINTNYFLLVFLHYLHI